MIRRAIVGGTFVALLMVGCSTAELHDSDGPASGPATYASDARGGECSDPIHSTNELPKGYVVFGDLAALPKRFETAVKLRAGDQRPWRGRVWWAKGGIAVRSGHVIEVSVKSRPADRA